MTPEWFEDLAQRLSDACQYAYSDDEISMARDFQMARQSALDYAYSTRKAIEEMRAQTEEPTAIETAKRPERHPAAKTRVA